MADSPGKVLSSFALSNEKNGNNSKLGGCAGVFFQILDRFNGKKFLPHKLLPSERSKHKSISHTVEKLPMARLLLIADEKRIADSRKDKDFLSGGVSEGNQTHEGKRKTSVSVVARLMGLETMPSPQPSTERKQIGAFKEKAEAQSTRKLLQHKRVPIKRVQRNSKSMEPGIHTLKRTTRPRTDCLGRLEVKVTCSNYATDALGYPSARSTLNGKSRSSETIAQRNSLKGEDPRVFIFSKLPLPGGIQAESPLRSILSPSRSSNKLLSPIKSPLSSKSTARLIGAAARVLEPNLRPARHLALSSRNPKGTTCGTADEGYKEQKVISSEPKSVPLSNVATGECKSQVTSRRLHPSPGKMKQFSPNDTTLSRSLYSKDRVRKTLPHVKHEKRPSKVVTTKNKSFLSHPCKLRKDNSSNGEHGSIKLSKEQKISARCTQIDNKQDNMLVPLLVREEASKEEGSTRAVRPHMSLVPRGSSSDKGSNQCTTSQPSSSGRCPKSLFSLSHTSVEAFIQEGSRSSAAARSAKDVKSTSGCKTYSTGVHGRTNIAQLKRESSCSRSSSKRKASSLAAEPTELPNTTGAEEADIKLENAGNERSMQKLACEMQTNFPQNNFSASAASIFDDCNAVGSSEAESRDRRTRGRARWDIPDEKKKSLTISYISCSKSDDLLPSYSSISSTVRGQHALESNAGAEKLLKELLPCPDASTSWPVSPALSTSNHKLLFCNDESEALSDHSTRCSKGLTGLLSERSTNQGGAQQESSSYDSVSLEDSSAQDFESVSGSFCAEECEQPSPISILESPFLDSASCSSDSFEAPQGIKLWHVIEKENFDIGCTVVDHVEDVKNDYIQTDKKSFTHVVSVLHCKDAGSSDEGATSDAVTENEERYVKQILNTALVSAETEVWERLAFSSPLIDPLIYYQLEENRLPTETETMPTGSYMEFEHENNLCSTRMHMTFTTCSKEAASEQRRLLFDCVEVALKLGLELAIRSNRFLVPCMQFPPAYLKEIVHKQLGEWKGLASSMNLDDMMKAEINTGMGRWFKYGDEVESVTATVEAMIFKGLIDELMKDTLVKRQASWVCS